MDEFLEYLSVIPDTRSSINKKHNLVEIIVLAVFGVISGCDSWAEIERYGIEKEKWFKGFLKLENGVPSHDTFTRVMGIIDPVALQNIFKDWILKLLKNPKIKHMALDGKILRGTSSSHKKFDHDGIVSAFSSDQGICVGHVEGNLKDEKKAFQNLIEILDIKKTVITIDANGLTAKIMNSIRDNKGDFIIAVKDPNKSMQNHIRYYTSKDDVKTFEENETKGHGRIEKRICTVANLPASFNTNLKKKRKSEHREGVYPLLNSCMKINSERTLKGKKSLETRLYISSLKKPEAKRCSELIRSHWEVENKLHWNLDVTFKEDNCTVKNKKASTNFSSLRRHVLNLFRIEKTEASSIRIKRKLASWNGDYALKVALGASIYDIGESVR